jgi:hypothetical protein
MNSGDTGLEACRIPKDADFKSLRVRNKKMKVKGDSFSILS